MLISGQALVVIVSQVTTLKPATSAMLPTFSLPTLHESQLDLKRTDPEFLRFPPLDEKASSVAITSGLRSFFLPQSGKHGSLGSG